jgi:hypothetical protein
MAEYVNKKELCRILCVSPHTAQMELNKAMQEGNGIVIKMGKTLRINLNRFIEWNSKRNSENFNNNKPPEEKKKWEGTRIKRGFTSEETSIGLTTMTKTDIAASNQLRQRIFRKR